MLCRLFSVTHYDVGSGHMVLASQWKATAGMNVWNMSFRLPGEETHPILLVWEHMFACVQAHEKENVLRIYKGSSPSRSRVPSR